MRRKPFACSPERANACRRMSMHAASACANGAAGAACAASGCSNGSMLPIAAMLLAFALQLAIFRLPPGCATALAEPDGNAPRMQPVGCVRAASAGLPARWALPLSKTFWLTRMVRVACHFYTGRVGEKGSRSSRTCSACKLLAVASRAHERAWMQACTGARACLCRQVTVCNAERRST